MRCVVWGLVFSGCWILNIFQFHPFSLVNHVHFFIRCCVHGYHQSPLSNRASSNVTCLSFFFKIGLVMYDVIVFSTGGTYCVEYGVPYNFCRSTIPWTLSNSFLSSSLFLSCSLRMSALIAPATPPVTAPMTAAPNTPFPIEYAPLFAKNFSFSPTLPLDRNCLYSDSDLYLPYLVIGVGS